VEQGRTVMALIRNELAHGRSPGDIAVLYRAHFHSIELQMELSRAGIPHTVTSGTGVFEQAHVKDMLALLRIVANPSDRLAFDRLMSLLPGVGPKSAAVIWSKLGGACNLSTPEGRAALLDLFKPAARGCWTGVSDAIADFFDKSSPGCGKVVLLVNAFIDSFYGAYLKKKYEDHADREDDVNEVAQQVEESGSLEAFLQEIALLTNAEAAYEGVDDLRSQTVRLSTIHQAKGLEWPVVILLWAVEGMFPSSRALGENGDDAEERRLFYVAVTRARNQLAVFTPEWRKSYDGGIYMSKPSRFVTEVPSSCFQMRYGLRY
jgi:DNA helicase-2/ATP-dependent DNA helicase PcrA